ncbi:substrate-binding domain-containing protein [Sinorhizobium sp. 7-81]|uniref:substrate-binding domain-containing protein n=1 Tax=Sinorhizobium sp. 8-89 TaxID=3049089 RepID=UPI0024C47169|nr:substrate-binding domain-containing protein [Sinorhizobium sp. 8-89]MDK1492498.1 substrate-binding domain-containing protein [Sinorhizobium sp. 8-89]
MTRIIFERGYQRPVFLNLSTAIVASQLRARGFVDAVAAHGRDLSNAVHTAEVLEAGKPPVYVADQILPRLMAEQPAPDLILCGKDLMAMNVYFLLAQLGLKVGKDVAVASFDKLHSIASHLQPGLCTMELPYYEMGRAAMNLAIDGAQGAQVLRLKGRFIERAPL